MITGALNKATATHIVNDTTIGLDISAAGLREYVTRAAPSKRLFVALYAHNKRRPLAPVNLDEDFLSVTEESEEASDSGSEDDVPLEKRYGKAPTAKELNEWRRRHRKAAAALEESERRERELLLEADSARLAANREALLELGVRAKAQSLLFEFSRQSVVASSGVTLSPEYAADVVALLRQLYACVTPAGDIALRGESDAAERAEAAEEAARDAWEHAVERGARRSSMRASGRGGALSEALTRGPCVGLDSGRFEPHVACGPMLCVTPVTRFPRGVSVPVATDSSSHQIHRISPSRPTFRRFSSRRFLKSPMIREELRSSIVSEGYPPTN